MRPTARVRYPDVCSRMLTYAHVCSPRSVTGCARICIRRAPHTSRGALLHFLIIFFNPPQRRIPRASRIKKFLIPLFFPRRIPRASRGALLQLRGGRTCTGAATIASRTRDAPARIRARSALRVGSHTLPASLR
jgi:hypothetical protein